MAALAPPGANRSRGNLCPFFHVVPLDAEVETAHPSKEPVTKANPSRGGGAKPRVPSFDKPCLPAGRLRMSGLDNRAAARGEIAHASPCRWRRFCLTELAWGNKRWTGVRWGS